MRCAAARASSGVDTTLPVGEESTWVFRVVEGDEAKAASVARALNILPEVVR